MKNIILILLFPLFFVSCGTSQHDLAWRVEQAKYKKECRNWYNTVGKKKFERKEGEETLSTQAVMIARCQEDPSICNPPQKHAELKTIEYEWKTPVTGEYCGSFNGEFIDDRFNENPTFKQMPRKVNGSRF